MAGIMIDPIAAVVAGAEPEMAANTADAITVTMARPPVRCRTTTAMVARPMAMAKGTLIAASPTKAATSTIAVTLMAGAALQPVVLRRPPHARRRTGRPARRRTGPCR